MNRLSSLAVSKRSVTLLFAAALFVAGISAWGSLKQELLPDIEFPVITIVAPYPGAGSSDVTEQVSKPIERAVGSVPRLAFIQSTSSNSISLVVTQFSFGTDVGATTTAIEDALAKAQLPASVTPTVQALNINASPVVISSIAATNPDGLDEVATIARTEIIPEIAAIEGVARADLTGGLTTRLAVTLDPAKLAAAGISSDQVVAILGANNLTLPSGQLPADGSKIPVSTIGRLTTVDEVKGLVVGYSGVPAAAQPRTSPAPSAATQPSAAPAAPKPVTLADLGTVELDEVAVTGYGRTNGQPALTLTVSKTSDANTVEVADAVQAKLTEIAARHSAEMTVTTVQDLSVFIKESRDGLLREGGLGAVFAILTIFLFLLSLRATIVAAISIPLSILTALVVMQLTGVTINILTLGGLAVAVGRVVDDAIVVLENIYRHRALGEDRRTAAINGPKEVAGAITASTLTTVAVFLPLGFVGGLVSQFFLPFALTVTFALLASLVCALTVVPVLAYFLLDRVKVDVDANGEPVQIHLGPRLHADHPVRPAEPLDEGRRRGGGHGPVLRLGCPCAAPPDPVHQRGLGEDPGRDRGSADRRELGRRPRQGRRGRDDPARRRRRRAGPDQHPGRRRHQLPGIPVGAARASHQQRDDDRAPGRGRRCRRRDHAPCHRARAGQDRTATTRRSRPVAGSPRTGSGSSSPARPRMTSPRRPTPSWPDWPTSRTSSTSRATSSRPRPRSR